MYLSERTSDLAKRTKLNCAIDSHAARGYSKITERREESAVIQAERALPLESIVSVERLVSFYCFYFENGHVFPGESHDFWEMIYIDKGTLLVTAGEETLSVSERQVIFHQPNEFHAFQVTSQMASIIVVSCVPRGERVNTFAGKRYALGVEERRLMYQLRKEGEQTFGRMMDSAYLVELRPLDSAPEGCCQMIRLYLEQLLILLLRRKSAMSDADRRTRLITEGRDAEELLRRVAEYMEEHIAGELNFEDVRSEFGLSATSLKNIFKLQTGMGVMEYYQQQRVNRARRMLRDGSYNITEVAERMGYSSIHAFSRQFRRLMGMSPTEYLKSIRYE